MSDLFDIANLITSVGVDAVKIKSEPGLPEKSSNEILTELFSTFDVPDDDDDEENNDSTIEDNKEDDKKEEEKELQKDDTIKVKIEKDDSEEGKKKKMKKKHKHKNEGKEKEKKHKHKKKVKHQSSDSASDTNNDGSKKKKKKKKSKRKHGFDADNEEPRSKLRKIDKTKESKHKSKDGSKNTDKFNFNSSETIKIKKEKIDPTDEIKPSEEKELQLEKNEKAKSPLLPSISKRLDDDTDAMDVPKLLEKLKNTAAPKILIKDLKNSEVFNSVVKEIEIKKKEKAERMEDGEISDSSDDSNRTPTLSPSPPHSAGGLHSDGKKYSRSPSSSKQITKKNDLRLVLKEKEKKKQIEDSGRSRSKSSRKEEKSRIRDKENDRSLSCHDRGRKTRSRSGDRGRRGRSRSMDRRDRRRGGGSARNRRDNSRHLSRSEDRNRNRRRGRSRSKERKERIEIDKKKLLEIARRNAINMIMKGKLPLAQQDKVIAAIQAGGKTIEELTDFCKNLSQSEAMGELSSISSGDESESEKGFHHPFLIKDRPSSIIMNIRDSKQLPTKTLLEKTTAAANQLRIQYPVSSGQQHRKNENEWIPVPPKPTKKSGPKPKQFIPAKELLQNDPLPLVVPPLSMQIAEQQQQQQQQQQQSLLPVQYPNQAQMLGQPDIALPQSYDPNLIPPISEQQPHLPQQIQQLHQPVQESIFPMPSVEPIDISAIVSQRLAAMRKLSENPNDAHALNEMHKAQTGMKNWVESKQIPGQFTGSTGAKVLTAAELNSGHQAWARKDQLLTAQPVSGGMGMALLQKMGWRPGEGLGKNKEGTLEPLTLEVKLDKRGLVSDQDIGAAKLGKVSKKEAVPMIKTLEGKHPVSLLGEFCSKRKYGAPVYELCFECGPDHKKNFLFKVKVNGIEYKPAVASPNKKLAKAEAAQVCLQNIGLLP